MAVKPKLFIGSSSEGKEIADLIQHGLEREVESTIWHQGVFGLSQGSLEALTNKVHDFDFAALILTPDDLLSTPFSPPSGPALALSTAFTPKANS